MKSHRVPYLIMVGWVFLIPIAYLGPTALTRYQPNADAIVWLCTAIALAIIVLLGRTTLMDTFALRTARIAWLALALGICAYVSVSFYLGTQLYRGFSPHLHQLGIFSQSYWTTMHGNLFANTHETVDGSLASHFGVHFSPTLLLLLPVYALFPSPLTLLFLQSLAVALGPAVLFILLRRELGCPGAAVISLGLLILPAFARAGWNDFHDLTFLPLFLLVAMVGLESRRNMLFAVGTILALGLREDVGLILLAMGLYILISRRGWKKALLVSSIGLAWFVLSVSVVIPRFHSPGLWIDPSGFFALHFGRWGDTPIAAAKGVLAEPGAFLREILSRERLHYVYGLLQPTLFVPLVFDPAWIMGVPHLATAVMSSHPWIRHILKYHALIPLLFGFVATARAASRLAIQGPEKGRNGRRLAISIVVVAGVLPALVLDHAPPRRRSPARDQARAVVDLIPPEVSVYVPISLYPHLADRKIVGCWESLGELGREEDMRGRFQWIVLWPGGDPPGEPRDAKLAEMLNDDERFERIAGYEPLMVYKRK